MQTLSPQEGGPENRSPKGWKAWYAGPAALDHLLASPKELRDRRCSSEVRRRRSCRETNIMTISGKVGGTVMMMLQVLLHVSPSSSKSQRESWD